MPNNQKQYENVNGVTLSLSMGMSHGNKGKEFTISFKDDKKHSSSISKPSLVMAVLVNIVAVLYVQLNITVILVIVTVFTFLLILWVTHSVQWESVVIIPLVGIQNATKYVYGREDKFIPWAAVDDVIINEVLHLNRVLYYLTVLVKENEETKLIPLFKHTKPRLSMLEAIYSEIQALLQAREYEEASGDN